MKKIKPIDVHGKLKNLGNLPIQNEICFVMDSVGEREKRIAKTPNCDSIGKHIVAYSHSLTSLVLPAPDGPSRTAKTERSSFALP